MLENYFWQFFDIMWLVLLLSQINTVCHCRFTVTAPRSQETWSKNQRRRSFKPWSSLALSSVHKNEEIMLQNWLCNWKLDYVCTCVNGHAVPRWSTHSYRVLPATLLTETRSNKLVSAPVSKASPEQAGQGLRSGENCQCSPFTCQAQWKEHRILKCAKAVSDSPFLTPVLLHRALGTSMEESLGL